MDALDAFDLRILTVLQRDARTPANELAAQNMSTYDTFTRRVLHAEEHVRSFKTLVVLQRPQRAAPLPPAV